MGLLDKLKGKKKGESSEAGDYPFQHYITESRPFVSTFIILKERHRKPSDIAVHLHLPPTGAIVHRPNHRHRLNWHLICRPDLRFKVLKGLFRSHCERW